MLEKKKYNRLTPIKIAYKKDRASYWLCQCDCGNTTTVREASIKNGHTKSCGCIRSDRMKYSNPRTTHGLRGHRLNSIWRGMKTRCYNKNSLEYSNYGGRGITVCKEWKDDFKSFYDWAMSHGYKEGLTIDRIDNNGNYEPNNCQWLTKSENVAKRFKDELKK